MINFNLRIFVWFVFLFQELDFEAFDFEALKLDFEASYWMKHSQCIKKKLLNLSLKFKLSRNHSGLLSLSKASACL